MSFRKTSAPVKNGGFEQLDLFTDYAAQQAQQEQEKQELEREQKMQTAMLTIKKKFGKNAILRGMNYWKKGQRPRTGNGRLEVIGRENRHMECGAAQAQKAA